MKKPYAKYMSAVCLFLFKKINNKEYVLLQRRGKKCSFAPNM
jgi:hypothetical protein